MAALTDTTIALMSYNIGINNNEVGANYWENKYRKLQNDVRSAFTHAAGIEVLLLSEFGNMFKSIDAILSSGFKQPTGHWVYSTEELFEDLLADIDLKHICVYANAPYVALIDSECWQVRHREVLEKLCTKEDIIVQHLILEHVDTKERCRCFNAHLPSTVATLRRKEDCSKKLCDIATSSAVPQRTACMPWILAGDLNVDPGTMSHWCQAFIEKGVPCFSKSEWPQAVNAQKSDFALSQGIALESFKSWLGYHSPPCASDIHDAVVVMGAIKTKAPQSTFTAPPLANSVWFRIAAMCAGAASSGVPQPADTGDTLHEDIQDVIENISLSAMADNGTLLEGDMPEESRYEDPDRRYTAQELLQMLYVDQGGYGVRDVGELQRSIAMPIQVRKNMIHRIAIYRQGVYTVQQNFDCYNSQPLSESDFQWALAQWKEEFPMNADTRQRIEAWQEENTRNSKKKAQALRNGAFKAYLHQECLNVQLALALLKHPTATVNTLLDELRQYLQSPQYQQEKARAQKPDENNADAVSEKRHQLQLKMRVHHLRHQVRQAKALHRGSKPITDKNRKLYAEWQSGKLTKKLDECTRMHGYGKLHSTGEMLEFSGFPGRR